MSEPHPTLGAAAAREGVGDLAGAERLYLDVLAADPAEHRAAYALGVLRMRSGRVGDALLLLEGVARREGAEPQQGLVYAQALAMAGRLDDAYEILRRLRHGGLIDARLDRLEAAVCMRKSADMPPAAAEPLLRRATELEPANLAAWSDLGGILTLLQRDEEAEACLRRAVALDPALHAAQANLGNLLRKVGQREEAKAAFRAAAASSDRLGLHLDASLTLSVITQSEDHIVEERASFAAGLDSLEAESRSLKYEGEPFSVPWFYLAYHGLDDRALLTRLGSVLSERMEGLSYASPQVEAWRGPAGRRIRVGFISSLFRDHSIGRMYEGFVRGLDRNRFEVILIHGTGGRRDAFSARIEAAADATIVLEGDLERQRKAIEAAAPDVLVYTDLGMVGPTYCLAHSRLAPVQVVAAGHPETTGIGAIDYFLSVDGMEPEGAEAHYAERLIRLDRNPLLMDAPEPVPPSPGRAALGLPAAGRLYGCPHTLFKFHPQFDAVLASIAEADPEGWILVPAAERPAWTRSLQARWRARHPRLAERVVWLPRVSREAFLQQLTHHDVVLDPLHFGSGNTFFLAVSQGVPVMTSPGAFMRGRVVSGMYRGSGVGESLIVDRPQDLAKAAVALASDPDRRRQVTIEVAEAAQAEWFSDPRASRSLETFLEAAVAAAAAGDLLPRGWRNGPAPG